MYPHTHTDEDDESVGVTDGVLKLSSGHINALNFAVRASQSHRVPTTIARLIESVVQSCRFRAIFQRPFNSLQECTVRGFGWQYHGAEDPRESYVALTVYILGLHPDKHYVVYGNLTLGPVGNANIRRGVRCTLKKDL